MEEKEVCQYCQDKARFNDIGQKENGSYDIVGVCDHHLLNYGVS